MHSITINSRLIGPDQPVYIIAEMSANHNQSFNEAVKIIQAAKEAGADAVKLQTYTPDTLTIDCYNEYFRIGKGTIWEGKNLYQLYGEAYTPWEWHAGLKAEAEKLGLDFFSTPFDDTAVDFLDKLGVGFFKVASFEVVDIPLLQKIASTGKPVIMSTGMASLAEIDEAVRTLCGGGCPGLVLLKCTSSYPALPEEMNLRTIPHLATAFACPVGLSDHTLGIAVPITAVAVGACIVEKHFTLSRTVPGPDSAFSLEPDEFKTMVKAIRIAEKALGTVRYTVTEREDASRIFRRSLFVVRDIRAGELFSKENVRSIRPGYGLHPRHMETVLGRKAACQVKRGTPLQWIHLAGGGGENL
jgi:pseudaminic acid synthase